MGWLSKKLKQAKKKLKKLKARDIVKAVSNVADIAGDILPSPFDKGAELVEKGLKDVVKKAEKIKKAGQETKSVVKTGDRRYYKKVDRANRKIASYQRKITKYRAKADLKPQKADRYNRRIAKYEAKISQLENFVSQYSGG